MTENRTLILESGPDLGNLLSVRLYFGLTPDCPLLFAVEQETFCLSNRGEVKTKRSAHLNHTEKSWNDPVLWLSSLIILNPDPCKCKVFGVATVVKMCICLCWVQR